MHIKRDYNRSFFSQRQQRRRLPTRLLFFFGLLAGGLLVFVYANLDELQAEAMDVLGFGPTVTPLPGDLATLADRFTVSGNLDAARDLFERAIEQRPDNIDYLYEYGQLLIDLGEPEQGIDLGDRIISINSADPRGWALKARATVWAGNSAAAINIARAGLDLGAGYEAPLYATLARAYANTGQYAEGGEAGALAIQTDPANPDARRSYAYSLSWLNDRAGAIEQLEVAIVLDPNDIDAHMELAAQYVAADRDQEAINIYNRVLALQPRNARALRRLCSTYRKIGEFDRAIGFCQDAVDADPQSAGARYDLAILQYNRFDFAAASENFATCVTIDPGSLACKHRLGLSYFYLGQCDDAWGTLQESLLMAQTAQGQGNDVSEIIANIQEGLRGVGQTCPQYGGLLPTSTPTPTPEGFVPEATVEPEATEPVTVNSGA
ncbi:MAG: tetratricopeptide repeat protein [Chloroflexota bacterium]